MPTKYFIRDRILPQTEMQIRKLNKLLFSAIIEAGKEINHNPLQKSLRKRIGIQKAKLEYWQIKYNELNNSC